MKFVSASALAAALLAVVLPAAAHDYAIGAIKVAHPWARETPPGATTAAVYVKLTNTAQSPVRLTGGTTPAAQRVEIHTMSINSGVMRMRPVPGVDIAPGQTLELKAGGLHLMLIGLNRRLMQEDLVPLTLTFAGGLQMPIEVYVEGVGAGTGAHGHP